MPNGIVVGFLGKRRDGGNKSWRPTVSIAERSDELLRIAGISKLQQLELLIPDDADHHRLWDEVAAVCKEKCPGLAVTKHVVRADFWDDEQMMDALLHYVKNLNPEPDTESVSYFVHTGAGTHVALICFYILVDSGIFQARLLQTIPPHKSATCFKIIPIRSQALLNEAIARAHEREMELKQHIDTKNKDYNSIIREIQEAAVSSRANILLLGETGVGKTYLVKRIADMQIKLGRIQAFVEENCAVLQGDLVASALFGHKKGSFTGATHDRVGKLKQADKGLIFLDEIGDLGLREQAMLLKAIEEKRFSPVGSDEVVTSDFQLICGTNKDLRELAQEKKFREDLLARIETWSFTIPPLRDRVDDMPAVLEDELARAGVPRGKKVWMADGAKALFLRFAQSKEAIWPGNLRDFNGAVVRMSTRAATGKITEEIVDQEIKHLGKLWHERANASPAFAALDTLGVCRSEYDLVDLHTLEAVIAVCKKSRTLSEASRILFNVTLTKKRSKNDASRLKGYLAKFDLDFADIKDPGRAAHEAR